MANHKSAIKRYKQSLVAKARNRAAKTRVKNAVKAVRLAIAQNDQEAASQAFKKAMSVLDKAAAKRVLHKKNAARRISRLNVLVNGQTEKE